jgi:hypothetical protein
MGQMQQFLGASRPILLRHTIALDIFADENCRWHEADSADLSSS